MKVQSVGFLIPDSEAKDFGLAIAYLDAYAAQNPWNQSARRVAQMLRDTPCRTYVSDSRDTGSSVSDHAEVA